MQNDDVLLERKDRVAIVTFNRPQRSNAFDEGMWAGLGAGRFAVAVASSACRGGHRVREEFLRGV